MQMMEQIRHTPAPTMGFTWSGATVGKTVFSVITALCILVGLIGARDDLPTELSANQIGISLSDTNRTPVEVAFVEPDSYSTRLSLPGIPVPTGERPLGAYGRASKEPANNSTNGAPIPRGGGAAKPGPRFATVATENAIEKLIYTGRVVDSDGKPVGGAEILYAVNRGHTKFGARTMTDGTFRLELLRPEPRTWESRLDIVVTHPNYAYLLRKLSLESTADIKIQLDAPGIIYGRVMNEAGEPILNAEAEIRFAAGGGVLPPQIGDYEDYSMLDIFHRTPPAKTDEDGIFIFRRLPPRAVTMLYVQAPGYAKTKRVLVPVGRQNLEFRLKREARIEGRLGYADTGETVANAKVDLRSANPLDGQWMADVEENGSFVLKNLGSGTYHLFLDSIDKGPKEWTAAARLGIMVTEGQTVSNMDLNLIRCGLVTGRLSDKDTGEPLSNIVYFHDASRPESQFSLHDTDTDETGVYNFHAAPGRVLVMTMAPPGYLDVGEVRKYVDVTAGEVASVDFEFSKGVELVVKLLTETGEPVRFAWVADEPVRNSRIGGRANELGEYTIRGLRPGQNLSLIAVKRELGLIGAAEVEAQADGTVEIRMQQDRQIKISGRVVDEKGKPMSSIQTSISPMNHQLDFNAVKVATEVGVTDSEGRFQVAGLVHDENYIIRAEVNRDLYYGASTGLFTATPQLTQLADIVVKKMPPDLAAKQQARNAYMNDARERSKTLTGQPAPELEIAEWLSGTPVSIGDLKGKTAALHFWQPVRTNYGQWINQLNSLHEIYQEDGLVCIAICATTAEVENVKRYITDHPPDYSVGLDRSTEIVGSQGKTFDRYAVWVPNSVVLINSDGAIAEIVHPEHGAFYPSDIDIRIKALLDY